MRLSRMPSWVVMLDTWMVSFAGSALSMSVWISPEKFPTRPSISCIVATMWKVMELAESSNA